MRTYVSEKRLKSCAPLQHPPREAAESAEDILYARRLSRSSRVLAPDHSRCDSKCARLVCVCIIIFYPPTSIICYKRTYDTSFFIRKIALIEENTHFFRRTAPHKAIKARERRKTKIIYIFLFIPYYN